jgi:hypothetical protein
MEAVTAAEPWLTTNALFFGVLDQREKPISACHCLPLRAQGTLYWRIVFSNDKQLPSGECRMGVAGGIARATAQVSLHLATVSFSACHCSH